MEIFILRHGQAEPQQTTDAARCLTERGRSETQAVMQQAFMRMSGLTQIWVSPLVRAQQTAAIAQTFFPDLELRTTELLVPEADPKAVYHWVEQLRSKSKAEANFTLLLVSHQPLVGSLVNQLCGKPVDYYSMGTSSLAALSAEIVAPALAELLWLLDA